MGKTHKTANGTELPILNLRGKDYLEVKYRLVWFREEHPLWAIETEFTLVTDKSACAKATIKDEQGRVIATSHKVEDTKGFPDFMEKAETGAIGRALALIGYGTQFCADELDEGARIVDSPVALSPKRVAVPAVIKPQAPGPEDGFPDTRKRIPYGSLAGRTYEEVGPSALLEAVEKGEAFYARQPKRKPADWEKFAHDAREWAALAREVEMEFEPGSEG